MAVISQIWIQHLNCLHIIGHCHLQAGSELEPELGGSLYTALAIALAEIEKSPQYVMSGVYGYKIPEFEGMGLFTIQNNKFRLFFLCEGLYGCGIPYLAGKKISDNIINLFERLEEIVPQETCLIPHKTEKESFWFNLMSSIGFGIHVPIEEVKTVYPLTEVRIKVKRQTNLNVNIINLETAHLGLVEHSWQDRERLISRRINGIFGNPSHGFQIYEALFHQISEFTPELKPNIIILTYQRSEAVETQSALVAFLFFKHDELYIQYCLPVNPGVIIEDSQSIHSCFQSLFLNYL